MRTALEKLLRDWRKLTKAEAKARLLKIAALLPLVILLAGCASPEPSPATSWPMPGWPTNATQSICITNTIYAGQMEAVTNMILQPKFYSRTNMITP